MPVPPDDLPRRSPRRPPRRSPPDRPHDLLESALRARGLRGIAGVDEVGRGPLAGPVVAAAVILDAARVPALLAAGVDDSKRLSPAARDRLDGLIRDSARVGLGEASVAEIEELNILRASHLAMARALAALAAVGLAPEHALIDGPHLPPGLAIPADAVVGGDRVSLSIAAASIVAKVWRDRIMRDLAQQHPGYGWERNMGYGSKSHIEALQALGITPHHRRTFAPVHKMLWQGGS